MNAANKLLLCEDGCKNVTIAERSIYHGLSLEPRLHLAILNEMHWLYSLRLATRELVTQRVATTTAQTHVR